MPTATLDYDELIGNSITLDEVNSTLYTVVATLTEILNGSEEINANEAIAGCANILNDQRGKLTKISKSYLDVEPVYPTNNT